jgi:hypothetical protein
VNVCPRKGARNQRPRKLTIHGLTPCWLHPQDPDLQVQESWCAAAAPGLTPVSDIIV